MPNNYSDLNLDPIPVQEMDNARDDELIVDYQNRLVYIKVRGEYYDVTELINTLLRRMINELQTNEEVLRNIFTTQIAGLAIGDALIRFNDGSVGTIKNLFTQLKNYTGDLFTSVRLLTEKLDTKISNNLTINGVSININEETGEQSYTLTPENINAINKNMIGAPNGVAPLDENAKVPEENLPVQGGFVAQDTPPDNTRLAWIDTSDGNIMKFYKDGEWHVTSPVWG